MRMPHLAARDDKRHFNSNGTCSCPMDGECIGCKKPCNDHDLVADYWMCRECLEAEWDRFEKECKENALHNPSRKS